MFKLPNLPKLPFPSIPYWVYAVVIFIVLLISYYMFTQNKIDNLNKNNGTLKLSESISTKTVEVIENNSKVQAENTKELNEKRNETSLESDKLKDIIIEHDLTRLSNAKPKLIEKRINNATKKVFDDIEKITDY